MSKILKHFYLEPEQVRYLEQKSNRTGKSQAQLIREMIDKHKKESVIDYEGR